MDNNVFFTEDALRKIGKEKLEIISKMVKDMHTKSSEERMQILFTYGMEMKSKGLKFTKDESSLLVDALKSNLSAEEKTKMDMLASMLKNM